LTPPAILTLDIGDEQDEYVGDATIQGRLATD
jgi:hypothetical protein